MNAAAREGMNTGENYWVVTHTRAALAEGLHYDDDVTAFVAARLGVEATRELGTQVYRARGWLGDQERQATLDALLADGWRFAGDVELEDGARFMLRASTTYVGHEVATYHAPQAVRAAMRGWSGTRSGGWVFIRKGASVTGWQADPKWLVREGWSA